MSVYRQMLGRALPCTVTELLGPVNGLAPSTQHHRLATGAGPRCPAELRTGFEHLAASRWGEAVRWLSQTDQERMPVCALLGLAVAFEHLGQHSESARRLDAAIARCETDTPTAGYLYRAYCAAGLQWERGGDQRKAAARYRRALAHRPDGAMAGWRLAALHLSGGRYAEAAFHLHEQLAHYPLDQLSRICLGHLLQLSGRRQDAVRQYEATVQLSSADGMPLPVSAAGGTRRRPTGTVRVSAYLPGQSPAACLRMGDYYSARGDDAAAIAHYRRALELYPDYLECRLAMARHEMRMSRPMIAADHLRDALAINCRHVELYAGLALSHLSGGRDPEALELLSIAARIARGSAILETEIHFAGTDCSPNRYEGTDDQRIDELMARDAATVAQQPWLLSVRLRLARLLRLQGRARQAVDVLRQCIRLDPWWTDAWLELAANMHDMARYPCAWAAVQSALNPDARSAALSYQLALASCSGLEWNLTAEKVDVAGSGAGCAAAISEAMSWMRSGRLRQRASAHSSTEPHRQADDDELS